MASATVQLAPATTSLPYPELHSVSSADSDRLPSAADVAEASDTTVSNENTPLVTAAPTPSAIAAAEYLHKVLKLNYDQLIFQTTKLCQTYEERERLAEDKRRELGRAEKQLYDTYIKFAANLYAMKKLSDQRGRGEGSWTQDCKKIGKARTEVERIIKGYEAYLTMLPAIQAAICDAGVKLTPLVVETAGVLRQEAVLNGTDIATPEFRDYCVQRFLTARADKQRADRERRKIERVQRDRSGNHEQDRAADERPTLTAEENASQVSANSSLTPTSVVEIAPKKPALGVREPQRLLELKATIRDYFDQISDSDARANEVRELMHFLESQLPSSVATGTNG